MRHYNKRTTISLIYLEMIYISPILVLKVQNILRTEQKGYGGE